MKIDNNEKKVLNNTYNNILNNVIYILSSTLENIKKHQMTESNKLLSECYNEGFNHAILLVEEYKQKAIDIINFVEGIDDINNN